MGDANLTIIVVASGIFFGTEEETTWHGCKDGMVTNQTSVATFVDATLVKNHAGGEEGEGVDEDGEDADAAEQAEGAEGWEGGGGPDAESNANNYDYNNYCSRPLPYKFVMEVMVMATPAWAIVAPILSVIDFDFSCSEIVRTFQCFVLLTTGKRTPPIKYN